MQVLQLILLNWGGDVGVFVGGGVCVRGLVYNMCIWLGCLGCVKRVGMYWKEG